MKKKFNNFISLLLSVLIISCDTGLGEEVDLEPPVLSVKELQSGETTLTDLFGGVYCAKNIEISGTAVDNKKVNKVSAEIKWSDDTEYVHLKDTSVKGDTWNVSLSLDREGVAFVRFTAQDENKNLGNKSSKVLALFVDETAPAASSWYIDRLNGIQYALRNKEELENLDLTQPENKDAAQNVSFSLRANFTDTMGIKNVSAQIFDEDGNKVCDVPNSLTSKYAPQFDVTEELLVAGKDELRSGKHYLEVRYTAEDIIKLPESNKTTELEFDGGWFIWWPESDNPKISQPNMTTDELTGAQSISLHVGDVISLTVFDDDELKDVQCVLLKETEAESFTPDSGWTNLLSAVSDPDRKASYTANSGEREKVLVVTADTTPQTMKLYAVVHDNTALNKTKTFEIPVYVADDTTPILLITSPEDNTIPPLTMSSDNQNATVTISGETLDSVGAKHLEFVWVPSSFENKTEKAKEYLETISNNSYPAPGSVKVTDAGLKVWGVSLSDEGTENSFIKQGFSFDVDIFNDFVYSGTNEKDKEKFFVAKLTRSDGNHVYQEYRLAADTPLPSIVPLTPSGDMATIASVTDLTLEFYGEKESRLPMDSSKYKIERVDVSPASVLSGTYDAASGTYKATVSASDLEEMKNSGIKPKFRFSATDLFGKTGTAQYTLVISNIPSLSKISSPTQLLCKKGSQITINASFTNTVNVTSGKVPRIKLTNITNSTDSSDHYALYSSGSGSTTLSFVYTVRENDKSDGVKLYDAANPIDINGTASLSGDNVNLNTLSSENNLFDTRKICIDGISPKVSSVTFTSDATSANTNNSVTYLREGRKLSAEVEISDTTLADSIFVQGSPKFIFREGLELAFEKVSGTRIIFSKKIVSDDINGSLTYIPSSCISDYDVISDKAGNQLELLSSSSATASNVVIDTQAPVKPKIQLGAYETTQKIQGTDYYYFNGTADFSLTNVASDTAKREYSPDGGSTWITSASLSANDYTTAQLTARVTDWAGNVSAYADVYNLYINSTFPEYTVECTNPDGNYKAGSSLKFKVYFEDSVKVASDSSAYIYVRGKDGEKFGLGENLGKAYVSSATQRNKYVSSVEFVYIVQDPDEFTVALEEGDVHLEGIIDLYGINGTTKTSPAYTRAGIKCDGVPPRVKTMTPKNETASGSNIYKNGNVITLTFAEPVQKSSGNLILRQTALWPIPPVLTADEFNKICGEISSADKDVLSMQEDGKDMQDVQDFLHSNGEAQDKYHGDAQYVGPYKKSTQGLILSGSRYIPDTKTTKYVLDFDIDIWETDEEHPIGKSFDDSYAESQGFQSRSRTGLVNVVTPSTTRTAQQIRNVLEKAHYHERTIDVTSAYVQIDDTGKTVTLTFPQGLCDESAGLPDGREWELVIEKGAFMDMTGNEFGVEPDGEMVMTKDAVQTCGTTPSQTSKDTASFGTWKRGRTEITDDSAPVVLIKTTDGNEAFFSDKVAKPVVRVDRYSYRLGVIQSDSEGEATSPALTDAVVPTGYVRVRIDCETKGASVKYSDNGNENSCTTTGYAGHYINNDNARSDSYYTSTADLTSVDGTLGNTYSGIFAGGYGHYNKSYKQFIIAQGTKTGFTASERGFEGIYQTVVQLSNPIYSNGSCANNGNGWTDVSLRGTTGFAGEPNISPFPLRDNHVASPYLCRLYREKTANSSSTDYYWVSYEILVESSFSNYSSNGSSYNWAQNWGVMEPGEYTYCTGMKNWN